ncbi:hypothetical protein K435DRAFT_776972 [Dendrothele bispora CBS 962.96]|uniref:Uncharacterized protein n=1 Tax=Dendrothele bispora (strain CBS 962.96) TaxID=1314807 RepID=A0A4V4HEG1_DENBC|nr:hypothetical protein K435DRAFT_780991 [Dendrothele bispora CBS 962.96]THU99477.1 hypothetical protein K435DRAFT_776972 [Dendrothele bispora CBS 962.96]
MARRQINTLSVQSRERSGYYNKRFASLVPQVPKARLTDLNPPAVQFHPRTVFVGHLI